MSRPAEELLEFPRLREIVGGFATCVAGRRAAVGLSFSTDVAALETEFALIGEAAAYLRTGTELGFGGMADPENWLPQLSVPASVLDKGQLLDAASLLDAGGVLKLALRAESARYPRLAEHAASVGDFRAIIAAIRRAIAPNGDIHDNASPALARIRAAMGQTREKVQHDLRQVLQVRAGEEGEDYITLRNERFVIPVRSAERRAVPGVVHGASASGQTLFVEPFAVVEVNNKLVRLAEEEAVEIARILTELTERLRAEHGPILHTTETISHLDSVFARARFAKSFDCAMPKFMPGRGLRLIAARNPVLEQALRAQQRTIVPVTIELGAFAATESGTASGIEASGTVMVISGPNTGGKTVALKTAGLAVLAAQSGIPVAADRAEMGLFDGVQADIGDEQSITADLSTFSAHVLNLKRILAEATDRTLVLLDEIGTGTAPEEGAALAVALLEEFRTRTCLTIATTHHDRVKTWATASPGIVNAAVEFDEERLRPTYRLLNGIPGVSRGLEIAARLGLAPELVERARAGLSPEARETRELIVWLHRSRDAQQQAERRLAQEQAQLEIDRDELKGEWSDRQRRRISQLEREFAGALAKLESEVAGLIGDVKDRKERARLEKMTIGRMGTARSDACENVNAAVVQHLSESQADLGSGVEAVSRPAAIEELVEGVRIRVRGFPQPVILRRRDDRTAEVEAGGLKMKVSLRDILSIEPAGAPDRRKEAAQSRGVTVSSHSSSEPSAVEINVIGCTVEEASRRVDEFLDDAALAQRPRVRIIHGHGTGALRRGLAEFLAGHPLVEKYYAEQQDRGGTAVTVVEIQG